MALTRLLCALAVVTASTAHANPLDHLRTVNDIGLHKIPHAGTSHILVIPVRTGPDGISVNEVTQLRAVFATEGGPGTFRDYWRVVSGGRYDPIPTLVEPVLYRDRCPIPGRDLSNCEISLSDIGLLLTKGIQAAYEDILTRVRDEQQIDLAQFDVNGASGPGADGYFDGLIFDADIYTGVAFPVAILDNTVVMTPTPGGGGDPIIAGIIAMSPPARHEFAHLLGFMDLYGGPTVNGLMEDVDATLSAFSRQQIGWGTVTKIEGATELDLPPVLDGGAVLRIDTPPGYLLIENRGGAQHAEYDSGAEGIYIYSVDESQLPTTPLGFLNVSNRELYLPNAEAPYLAVAMPVGCDVRDVGGASACVVANGEPRALVHASGASTGLVLQAGLAAADGTIRIVIGPEALPPPDPPPDPPPEDPPAEDPKASGRPSSPTAKASGCTAVGAGGAELATLLLCAGLALFGRRERRS